jgi:hypothetical protein
LWSWWSRATAVLEQPSPRKFEISLNDLKLTWYGDQHHPILSGDIVVAAFNQQNVLEI